VKETSQILTSNRLKASAEYKFPETQDKVRDTGLYSALMFSINFNHSMLKSKPETSTTHLDNTQNAKE
jgi:hypothetical protein